MKKPKIKLYRCVGQNFIKGELKHGTMKCGDVGTLDDWIEDVYGERGKEYFSGYRPEEVIAYFLEYAGLRLKQLKRSANRL